MAIILPTSFNVVIEGISKALKQVLPFDPQGFPGRDEARKLAFAVSIGRDEAHSHTE
ncbi:hypothetical protein ACFOYU_12830 [Microvirga sp. GCM10011540]|uniref:hypothetical protein n=1 Tax=Microvirga sp. GCM10011540 TaxID=3317338 RepID=UPI00361EF44A